jgi:hypothetical protein
MFPLVHTWSWSYAYACKRCTEERDEGDVPYDVPGGVGTSREPEVQSDGTGWDVGAIREAEAKSLPLSVKASPKAL